MKKKKRRVKNKTIIFLIIVIIIIGIYIFISNKPKQKPTQQVEVVDSIDNFEYELNDNETKYYKDLFNALKELLNDENYDEEKYAELVGKLFLADFYDLDSKIMKSDVGGTQFVHEPYREDFEKGATDALYKYVESNVYGDRKQSLPIVKEVTVDNIETNTFKYNDEVDNNAYYLTMNITYTKDLGYPNKVDLILIHNNEKLEIAKLETK